MRIGKQCIPARNAAVIAARPAKLHHTELRISERAEGKHPFEFRLWRVYADGTAEPTQTSYFCLDRAELFAMRDAIDAVLSTADGSRSDETQSAEKNGG